MTNRVDRLAARGFVERHPDPDDRRGVIVRLTAEGKTAVDGAFEALLDAERTCSPTSRRASSTQLAALLRTLLAPFSLSGRRPALTRAARRPPATPARASSFSAASPCSSSLSSASLS